VDKDARMGRKMLSHPQYSRDLAPNNFNLFGRLKESLREGLKFKDN